MWHDTNIPERRVLHLLCGVSFSPILFPKVYKMFDATVQKSVLKTLKTTTKIFFFWSGLRLRNSFWESASVALV